jgi:predicted dehydrogenase
MINQTPHQLDVLQWLMGPIDELFGYWDNLNHPYIEVEDTAVAVIRFKSGAIANVLVSNSQKPGFYGKIHIHGSNGASVGAQAEGGSPFIAGISTAIEPPINDIWTIPGEEHLLVGWQAEDRQAAAQINTMTHYHQLQIEDFLGAISEDREPLVNGHEGRKVVEMITAVYRAQRDGHPIKFPLKAEQNSDDYDGRLGYAPFSHRTR